MKILVTGAAGFIGAALCHRLLQRGDEVVGVDNLNEYYDVKLKHTRLERLLPAPGFRFQRLDIADAAGLLALFQRFKPQRVMHAAAQAGVRYSLQNPHAYGSSNLVGFLHVLEACRHHQIEHLVFASSSSVYGANSRLPFSTHDNVDHPVSLYAATKKANELMAHSYSHLYQLPATGLRFFTVYGPWGRPDMTPLLFTRKILAGEPLDVFNQGNHRRDFTYIDDIIEGVVRVLDHPAQADPAWDSANPNPASSRAPYRMYNIGNNQPVELLEYIATLERAIGKPALKNLLPMQPGDVQDTWADIDDLQRDFGYRPNTPLEQGIALLVAWYKEYYQ
jgi:UDP-glucuronate 4-epimerase